MLNKTSNGKGEPALPEEVLNLIIRKLRHRQREQQKQIVTANQTAYARLRDEVLANIRIGNNRNALTSVPLAWFRCLFGRTHTFPSKSLRCVWHWR